VLNALQQVEDAAVYAAELSHYTLEPERKLESYFAQASRVGKEKRLPFVLGPDKWTLNNLAIHKDRFKTFPYPCMRPDDMALARSLIGDKKLTEGFINSEWKHKIHDLIVKHQFAYETSLHEWDVKVSEVMHEVTNITGVDMEYEYFLSARTAWPAEFADAVHKEIVSLSDNDFAVAHDPQFTPIQDVQFGLWERISAYRQGAITATEVVSGVGGLHGHLPCGEDF